MNEWQVCVFISFEQILCLASVSRWESVDKCSVGFGQESVNQLTGNHLTSAQDGHD